MYVVIETWTPRAEFLAATPETRERVFDSVREGMAQFTALGIDTLGWGRIDAGADRSGGYDWFAVWTMPSAELAAAFLQGVEAAGWYEWFDQTNVTGELASVDSAIAAHLALAAPDVTG